MSTERWHPDMDDHPTLIQMVKAIHDRTARMEVSLFGPPEAPHMGFISRTDVSIEDHDKRISWVEKKIYLWIGVLAALIWGAERLLR